MAANVWVSASLPKHYHRNHYARHRDPPDCAGLPSSPQRADASVRSDCEDRGLDCRVWLASNPVLISAGDVIIAGHGRVLGQPEKLGLAEVPVIVLSHLSEPQRRALVIADNRIAENVGWDEAEPRQQPAHPQPQSMAH